MSVGGDLIYIKDTISGLRFLADTGAAVSILPYKSTKVPSRLRLVAADGRHIPTWGKKCISVCFNKTVFKYDFVLAAVSQPILGIDFLKKFLLTVDTVNNCLMSLVHCKNFSVETRSEQDHGDSSEFHSQQLRGQVELGSRARSLPSSSLSQQPVGQDKPGHETCPTLQSSTPALPKQLPTRVRHLLQQFPSIISNGAVHRHPLHGVQHVIETTGRPVFAHPRRLDPEKQALAEQEFRELEQAGIVRRSNSPWSSPLHMVPKKDGSWRPCGDYRRLNVATTPDKYPLPNLQDAASKMHGCRVFSKLDLVKGYHQVPVAPADVPKTAITTPFGMFEYLYMPFGLRNAAQTFQRLMDFIFGFLAFVFVYLDDLIIYSRDEKEHEDHLQQVLQLLSNNGLVINPAKCVFFQKEVEFLGHTVDSTGMRPLSRHVQAINNFPPPTDIKALQRFLGLVNFYRRFLAGAACFLKPLTDALAGSPKKLEWTSTMQQAFEKAKAAVAAAVKLVHPAPGATVSLAVDASATHVGGVLQQWSSSGWQPLSFFSHKLSKTERNYGAFDRELLAAYMGIRHFRFALEGRPFQLHTDHKPLVAALKRVDPPWTARQQRHLSFISEFTTDLRHVPGLQNTVADALSRPDPDVVPPPPPDRWTVQHVDAAHENTAPSAAEMAQQQLTCPEVQRMRQLTSLNITSQQVAGDQLYGDISTGIFRPLVPVSLRRRVFTSLHGISHPGRRATRRLISARFVWPSLAKEVTEWAKQCLACQRGKIARHVHVAPEPIPVPHRRFAHLHVDLVGPLPTADGCSHLLTVVDRSTRWPDAFPITDTTAATCARTLLAGWVARFGVPETITSDRGAQFTSSLWRSICSLLGINHQQTTAYHPQSNGLVERFHRRLKDSLRARLAAADWPSQLPWVLLGIRATPREDSNSSPAEAVYGSPIILPGQFLGTAEPPATFYEELRQAMAHFQPVQPAHNTAENRKAPVQLPSDLAATRYVLVRRDGHIPPLTPLYDGPYLVLQRSLRTFRIQVGRRQETVSTQRLKAVADDPGTEPAQPRQRGRPPKTPGRQVRFSPDPATIIPSRRTERPVRATRPPDFFVPS